MPKIQRRSMQDVLATRKAVEPVTETPVYQDTGTSTVKITPYIRPETEELMNELYKIIYKQTGKRPSKGALIDEAIPLLMEKYQLH